MYEPHLWKCNSNSVRSSCFSVGLKLQPTYLDCIERSSSLPLKARSLVFVCTVTWSVMLNNPRANTLMFVTRSCNCISGVFVVSPTNPSERAHLSTLQSKEPLSESQKAQEETGWMKSRRLTSCVTCPSTLPEEWQICPDFTELQTQVWLSHYFLFKCNVSTMFLL